MCSDLCNGFSSVFGLRSSLEVGISLGICARVSLNPKVGQTTYLPVVGHGATVLGALYGYWLLSASAELQPCTAPVGLLAEVSLQLLPVSWLCIAFGG